MWVLRIEPETAERADSALSHLAISPAPALQRYFGSTNPISDGGIQEENGS